MTEQGERDEAVAGAPKSYEQICADKDYLGNRLREAKKRLQEAEEELAAKTGILDELAVSLANEKPGSIEHLLACGMIGKHTAVIGRSRLQQLYQAEDQLATERTAREQAEADYKHVCAELSDCRKRWYRRFQKMLVRIAGLNRTLNEHVEQSEAACAAKDDELRRLREASKRLFSAAYRWHLIEDDEDTKTKRHELALEELYLANAEVGLLIGEIDGYKKYKQPPQPERSEP